MTMADKDSVSYSFDTEEKHCPIGVIDECCPGHGIKENCSDYSASSGCTHIGPKGDWERWAIEKGIANLPVRADVTGVEDVKYMKGAGTGGVGTGKPG